MYIYVGGSLQGGHPFACPSCQSQGYLTPPKAQELSEDDDFRGWNISVGEHSGERGLYSPGAPRIVCHGITLQFPPSPLTATLRSSCSVQESVLTGQSWCEKGFSSRSLQKKMTQFLPSPFRTILHAACHWPACNRWLSAQHPGDRAVKCHQTQTSQSLNSLHQTWIMVPCLS